MKTLTNYNAYYYVDKLSYIAIKNYLNNTSRDEWKDEMWNVLQELSLSKTILTGEEPCDTSTFISMSIKLKGYDTPLKEYKIEIETRYE